MARRTGTCGSARNRTRRCASRARPRNKCRVTGTGPPATGTSLPMPPSGIVPAPPADPASLNPKIEQWPVGTVLYRGHEFGPYGRRFNPRFGGPRRFSFFQDKTGKNVPVLYAGKTIDVAIAETLFH